MWRRLAIQSELTAVRLGTKAAISDLRSSPLRVPANSDASADSPSAGKSNEWCRSSRINRVGVMRGIICRGAVFRPDAGGQVADGATALRGVGWWIQENFPENCASRLFPVLNETPAGEPGMSDGGKTMSDRGNLTSDRGRLTSGEGWLTPVGGNLTSGGVRLRSDGGVVT